MAAPKEGGQPSEESDYCEETDVFSANFDPLRALYDENVRLSFPEAEPFPNMSKFLDHLNRQVDIGQCSRLLDDEPIRRTDIAAASDTDKRGSQANPGSSTDTIKKRREVGRNRTILTIMNDATGPLSLLGWSKENKRKVKVCTRTFKGLRGICIGYVVAFDRFLNLALADVDEIYRKPPLGQTIYHQEILTFSKIMEHFQMRKDSVVTQKPEEVKKCKRNRKERKMRLEVKMKAEGVFIENYHPPPASGDQSTAGAEEGDLVCSPEASSRITPTNDEDRINRLQRLTANILSSRGETLRESTSDETSVQVESVVNPEGTDVTPEGSDTRAGGTDQSPKMRGKDVVKHEDFVWRHVKQIFLRGDNIVLISVDKDR